MGIVQLRRPVVTLAYSCKLNQSWVFLLYPVWVNWTQPGIEPPITWSCIVKSNALPTELTRLKPPITRLCTVTSDSLPTELTEPTKDTCQFSKIRMSAARLTQFVWQHSKCKINDKQNIFRPGKSQIKILISAHFKVFNLSIDTDILNLDYTSLPLPSSSVHVGVTRGYPGSRHYGNIIALNNQAVDAHQTMTPYCWNYPPLHHPVMSASIVVTFTTRTMCNYPQE